MMPDVFPRPREISPTGTAAPAGWRLREEAAPELPAQGYELVADGDGVVLRSADGAGRRYGRATLRQLAAEGEAVDGVRIRDWPDFPTRGLMLT